MMSSSSERHQSTPAVSDAVIQTPPVSSVDTPSPLSVNRPISSGVMSFDVDSVNVNAAEQDDQCTSFGVSESLTETNLFPLRTFGLGFSERSMQRNSTTMDQPSYLHDTMSMQDNPTIMERPSYLRDIMPGGSKYPQDFKSALEHKVYTISVLKDLRIATKRVPRKQLKLSEEAPLELVLKPDPEEEQIMYKRNPPKPMPPARQPHGPPEGSLLQEHQGFARFIKEHSSPPHNRVTAGGRIVPAGPLSPPPMYRMDTIDKVIDEHQEAKRQENTSDYLQEPAVDSAGTLEEEIPPSGDTKLDNAVIKSDENKTSDLNIKSAEASEDPNVGIVKVENSTNACAIPQGPTVATTAVPLVPQFPIGAEHAAMMGDGTTIVSLNGTMYRAVRYGANTVLEPMQVVQPHAYPPMVPFPQTFPAQHGYPFQQFPQVQYHSVPAPIEYGFYPTGPQLVDPSLQSIVQQPLFGIPPEIATTHINPPPPQPDFQAHLHFLTSQYNTKKTALEALEKHIALHRHELPGPQLMSLSAQRKILTEEVDKARVSKKKFEQEMPIKAPTDFTPGLTTWPHSNAVDVSGQATGSIVHEQNAKTSSKPTWQFNASGTAAALSRPNELSSATQRMLSPNAPSFVPTSTSTHTVHKSEQKARMNLPVRTTQDPPRIPEDTAQESVSSADPVVLQSDVEYCDRLGFNDPNMPKVYCSEIPEFVEVLKTVREQAKLYGCQGGQSKDPEFMAEEDVRWAMEHGMPIPLPTAVRDHEFNPRPWDWSQSAFNVEYLHGQNWRPQGHFRPPGVVQKESVRGVLDTAQILELNAIEPTHKRSNSWDTPQGSGDENAGIRERSSLAERNLGSQTQPNKESHAWNNNHSVQAEPYKEKFMLDKEQLDRLVADGIQKEKNKSRKGKARMKAAAKQSPGSVTKGRAEAAPPSTQVPVTSQSGNSWNRYVANNGPNHHGTNLVPESSNIPPENSDGRSNLAQAQVQARQSPKPVQRENTLFDKFGRRRKDSWDNLGSIAALGPKVEDYGSWTGNEGPGNMHAAWVQGANHSTNPAVKYGGWNGLAATGNAQVPWGQAPTSSTTPALGSYYVARNPIQRGHQAPNATQLSNGPNVPNFSRSGTGPGWKASGMPYQPRREESWDTAGYPEPKNSWETPYFDSEDRNHGGQQQDFWGSSAQNVIPTSSYMSAPAKKYAPNEANGPTYGLSGQPQSARFQVSAVPQIHHKGYQATVEYVGDDDAMTVGRATARKEACEKKVSIPYSRKEDNSGISGSRRVTPAKGNTWNSNSTIINNQNTPSASRTPGSWDPYAHRKKSTDTLGFWTPSKQDARSSLGPFHHIPRSVAPMSTWNDPNQPGPHAAWIQYSTQHAVNTSSREGPGGAYLLTQTKANNQTPAGNTNWGGPSGGYSRDSGTSNGHNQAFDDVFINPEEVKSVAVNSPIDDGKAKGLLRDMLPRKPMQRLGETFEAFGERYSAPDKASNSKKAASEWRADVTGKRHQTPPKARNENRPLGDKSTATNKGSEKAPTHKARSSVASPTFHARGRIPHVGGTATTMLNLGNHAGPRKNDASLALSHGGASLYNQAPPHDPTYGLGSRSSHGTDRTVVLQPHGRYHGVGDRSFAGLRAHGRTDLPGNQHFQSPDW